MCRPAPGRRAGPPSTSVVHHGPSGARTRPSRRTRCGSPGRSGRPDFPSGTYRPCPEPLRSTFRRAERRHRNVLGNVQHVRPAGRHATGATAESGRRVRRTIRSHQGSISVHAPPTALAVQNGELDHRDLRRIRYVLDAIALRFPRTSGYAISRIQARTDWRAMASPSISVPTLRRRSAIPSLGSVETDMEFTSK